MLTVVIPTIRYSSSLDKALCSVFNNLLSTNPTVIVAVGSDLEEFKDSGFWDNDNVIWHVAEDYCRNSSSGLAMTYHNINSALLLIEDGWILILADDDELYSDFDPDVYGSNDAVLFSVKIVDKKGTELRKPRYYNESNNLDPTSVLLGDVQSHLSLIVYKKQLITEVGFYSVSYGYPNGYYGDTITNAKLLTYARNIGFSSMPLTLRYESVTQESSKLYFEENERYLWNVVNEVFNDELIGKDLKNKGYNPNTFHSKLLYDRYSLEIWKAKSKIFSKSDLVNQLFRAILYSNLSITRRVKLLMKLFCGIN